MAESSNEHLINHLRAVHAIEVHAIRQLERAVQRRDEELQSVYEPHLEESRKHDEKLRELVEGQGREVTAIEDKTLHGRSIGLRQLADIALDTPVKLAMNLFAVEHLEIAAYELLAEIARATDDDDVARVAEEILKQERAAAEKVEQTFDQAVESLMEGATDDSSREELLVSHLRDVHALEQQSLQLLRTAIEEVCEDEQLAQTYREHLEQTEKHEEVVAQRLEDHEMKPSAVRDLHMRAAKAGLNELMDKPPDGQAKMAMNLFAVEALEIAGYELLVRIAERSDDGETGQAAQKLLDEEREAAKSIQEGFARTVELMLQSEASYEEAGGAEVPAGQASEA
jgi:ferritin-like metal-binding protein YciE